MKTTLAEREHLIVSAARQCRLKIVGVVELENVTVRHDLLPRSPTRLRGDALSHTSLHIQHVPKAPTMQMRRHQFSASHRHAALPQVTVRRSADRVTAAPDADRWAIRRFDRPNFGPAGWWTAIRRTRPGRLPRSARAPKSHDAGRRR